MKLIPKDKAHVHAPEGGWEQRTWYLVEVSYSSNNPVHEAMVFTGFLNEFGEPQGYSAIFAANAPSDPTPFHRAYYMKPLKKLHTYKYGVL